MVMMTTFKDVTEWLDEVTQEFEVGRLIRYEPFSLFDSMSAIEIMDPKMDSGMILESSDEETDDEVSISSKEESSTKVSASKTKRQNRRSTLDEAFVIAQGEKYSLQDVVEIMDLIISCMATFLSGYSMANTLFTCIHLHYPSSIPCDILRTFVRGTLKFTGRVRTVVRIANIYEDEDFNTDAFHFNLLEAISEDAVLQDIQRTIDGLSQETLKTHSVGQKADTEPFIKECLSDRLMFLKSFLAALTLLAQRNVAKGTAEIETMKQVLSKILASSPKLYQHQSYDDSKALRRRRRNLGFDPLMNKKLIIGTPPRKIPIMSLTMAANSLSQTSENLLKACSVIQCKSTDDLLTFLHYFTRRIPQPCCLSRCQLQALVLTQGGMVLGTMSLQDYVRKMITEFCNPPYLNIRDSPKPSVISTNRAFDNKRPLTIDQPSSDLSLSERVNELVTSFLELSEKYVLDFIRTYTHNVARQRRILVKLVNHFDTLQLEAESYDSELELLTEETSCPFYFSSWAYSIKLHIMADIIASGFHLELYSSHEMSMMYWYFDYLLSIGVQHSERRHKLLEYANRKLPRIQKITTSPAPALPSPPNNAKKSGKRKKNQPRDQEDLLSSLTLNDIPDSPKPASLSLVEAKQDMCRAMFRFAIALKVLKLYIPPDCTSVVPELHFANRFRYFRHVSTPGPLIYEQYSKNSNFMSAHVSFPFHYIFDYYD
ncbi:Mak10 subunit, NatC N-terminal acetyltransferase-domain-containing protein [Paraphysoderma sedebokerense]|nr:Mak10 subunit, NatC N-terminal acetyltransferase-domain-containing protein [Paraphysoderma sedebokerense]